MKMRPSHLQSLIVIHNTLQNILKEFQFRSIQFHSVLSGIILGDLGILLLSVQKYTDVHKYKTGYCVETHFRDDNFIIKENFTLKM